MYNFIPESWESYLKRTEFFVRTAISVISHTELTVCETKNIELGYG